jgi:hypothetical protein
MDELLREYCSKRRISVGVELGGGKDGTVYASSRRSAVKIHVSNESYAAELDAYIRLRECGITKVWGFNIPSLLDYDNACRVIEMSIVTPPYLLDFASAHLDFERPDFPEEVLEKWHADIQESFGDRSADVMAALEILERDAGVVLLDIHRHNVKFENESP